MTPSMLAWLRNESNDVPAEVTRLAIFVKHWRDRLQTEDARAALTDDLPLEASTASETAVNMALAAWADTAEAAWLAYAGVADEAALSAAIEAAIATDALWGWASAHDALGACGLASVDDALGRSTCACCFSCARLGRTVDGQAVGYAETVEGLQATLRAVLVGLCG